MFEIETTGGAAPANADVVARYSKAAFPDLMPIYVNELPEVLLKLFGIKIEPRQATEYGTKRKLGIAECPITGKLATTVPRIKKMLESESDPATENREIGASPGASAAPRRRRGRPRGSKRLSQ